MRSLVAAGVAAGLLCLANCSTLTPPVLPLIVRNPYLSTWLGNAREEPWSEWPMFWNGQSIGFSILASVADSSLVYPLLGRAHDALDDSSSHYNVSFPTYNGAQYDASTTNLSYSLPTPEASSDSPVELVISFLSPITPTSTLRQSIPASYISIHVRGSFDVNVYIDLNGEWVSRNRDSEIVWSFKQDEDDEKALKTFAFKRRQELLFTEHQQRAEWGELHFTGPSDVKHECGTSGVLRQHFSKRGALRDRIDDNFREIMDNELQNSI